MIAIQIRRNRTTSDATFGELSINDQLVCYTMERNSVIIPAGTYSVEFTFSPHFHRIMPLLNVPGREGIRIHWANYPNELEGCIAVGTQEEIDALDNSKIAFDKLMALIELETDITVTIIETLPQ